MKKISGYKRPYNLERLVLTALVGSVFCGFLLVAIWQFQSEEEIMSNTEIITKNPTRNDSIKINAPKINEQIKSPVQLSGQVTAFGAQVNVRIKDNSGLILSESSFTTEEEQVMSPFSIKIKYKKPSNSRGIIEVFEISAKDGLEIHKIFIPVIFRD